MGSAVAIFILLGLLLLGFLWWLGLFNLLLFGLLWWFGFFGDLGLLFLSGAGSSGVFNFIGLDFFGLSTLALHRNFGEGPPLRG